MKKNYCFIVYKILSHCQTMVQLALSKINGNAMISRSFKRCNFDKNRYKVILQHIYFYNGITLDIILNKDLPQYQDVYKRIKTLAFAKNDGGKLLTNFSKSK